MDDGRVVFSAVERALCSITTLPGRHPTNWDDRSQWYTINKVFLWVVGGGDREIEKSMSIYHLRLAHQETLPPSSVPYQHRPSLQGAGHEPARGPAVPPKRGPRRSADLKRRQIYRSPREILCLSSDGHLHCVSSPPGTGDYR